ncbi:MAG: PTS sugar transporter subunit IIA [bacterium]
MSKDNNNGELIKSGQVHEENTIVGVVIVAHGNLAEALLTSSESIVGPLEKVKAVSIDSRNGVDRAMQNIREAIEEVDAGAGVLILTDMFGGSPSNLSLSFLSEKHIEVVTGVNLPMLLKLSSYRQGHRLEEIKEVMCRYGREKIIAASDLLNKQLREKKLKS